MHDQHQPETSAAGLRIAVAVSRYHARITDALCEAALDCFRSAGGDEELLVVVRAAGTFDLTALCRALADRGDLDAVVALGCIISGETPHDRYIASAVATGLTMITVRTGCPIAFGVLTCGTIEQALARAGGAHGNKGAEAMAAAIDTSQTIRALGLARRCT